VFTIGDRQVRDLELITDHWYEIKWSLKGDQEALDRFLKWNIQVGEKNHSNPALPDAFFFRLYRDHLDKNQHDVFSLENASLDCRAELPARDFSSLARLPDGFSLLYLDVGEKFPSRKWPRIVYTLNAGFSWKKYNDLAQANRYTKSLSFFVRPNVLF
jgi:hypothetical protein